MSNHSALSELRDWLSAAGDEPDAHELGARLAVAWHLFRGGRAEGMQRGKLLGRVESPRWSPPVLEFRIERHGGTMQGSTRAEMQRWTLDLDALTAHCARGGHRQLKSMAPRLDLTPTVAEIAALVQAGARDPRLKWEGDTVTVLVGFIAELRAGSAVSRTLKGRRERFREKLVPALVPLGWRLEEPVMMRSRLRFRRSPLPDAADKPG